MLEVGVVIDKLKGDIHESIYELHDSVRDKADGEVQATGGHLAGGGLLVSEKKVPLKLTFLIRTKLSELERFR